jgi:DNA transformation protein
VPARRAANSQAQGVATGSTLAEAANLGPKSAAVLARVGVTQLEQLKSLGSVRVFGLARQAEPRVTLNLLWALEGAILGQTWQSVAREHRGSLLLAVEDHERYGRAE